MSLFSCFFVNINHFIHTQKKNFFDDENDQLKKNHHNIHKNHQNINKDHHNIHKNHHNDANVQ